MNGVIVQAERRGLSPVVFKLIVISSERNASTDQFINDILGISPTGMYARSSAATCSVEFTPTGGLDKVWMADTRRLRTLSKRLWRSDIADVSGSSLHKTPKIAASSIDCAATCPYMWHHWIAAVRLLVSVPRRSTRFLEATHRRRRLKQTCLGEAARVVLVRCTSTTVELLVFLLADINDGGVEVL